jgi:hypothetical protein
MVKIILCILLIAAVSAQAESVNLKWNANTETDLAGYRIYYQADNPLPPFIGTGATEGASPVDVGNVTTGTISGLAPGHVYYFAATAYNTSALESIYSNVVIVSFMPVAVIRASGRFTFR